MSGHYSRILYDDCAFCEAVQISTNPGKYRLYQGQTKHNEPCIVPTGPRNTRSRASSEVIFGTCGQRTDVESLLTNRDTPNAKCHRDRTLAEKNAKLNKLSLLYNNPVCNKFLQPEDTRLTHPPDTLRGIYIDRYEYPIVDPQSEVYYGFDPTTDRNRFGASSRLYIRDNYRIKKLVPFDNGIVFPNENRRRREDMPDVTMCKDADLSTCNAVAYKPNPFDRDFRGDKI